MAWKAYQVKIIEGMTPLLMQFTFKNHFIWALYMEVDDDIKAQVENHHQAIKGRVSDDKEEAHQR